MTTLIAATRNRHKAQEIRAILGPDFPVLDLTEFAGAPPVLEDAPTFAGNALKKASSLAAWLHQQKARPALVLADDSGLEVDALKGAPGVHSARFAALDTGAPAGDSDNTPDTANNAKLLRLLADTPMEKRTARFRCVLALAPTHEGTANPNPHLNPSSNPLLFEGVCEGRIAFAPKGQGGFGYDPLFVPAGFQESFAELGEAIKNGLSHRARALAKLKEFLVSIGA